MITATGLIYVPAIATQPRVALWMRWAITAKGREKRLAALKVVHTTLDQWIKDQRLKQKIYRDTADALACMALRRHTGSDFDYHGDRWAEPVWDAMTTGEAALFTDLLQMASGIDVELRDANRRRRRVAYTLDVLTGGR